MKFFVTLIKENQLHAVTRLSLNEITKCTTQPFTGKSNYLGVWVHHCIALVSAGQMTLVTSFLIFVVTGLGALL